MSDPKKKGQAQEQETGSRYFTQTQTLPIRSKHSQLVIGIPKETILQENRVALVPASVANLVAHGHRVLVEQKAGEKAFYSDLRFSEAGAEITYSREKVLQSNIVVKITPPTLEEIECFGPGQTVISPLHLPIITSEYLELLKRKRVTALAMDYIRDEMGSYPIVRIISEMAGRCAMLTAAELLTKKGGGKGVLLGGVSGVPSAKVVIIGAGVVAEFAAKVAIGLGADIRIFENNIFKLMRLQNRVGRQLNTSSLNPMQLEKELQTADVVIGALHSKTGRTPVLVREETVEGMKEGSVIVDVSIDQGGCFATSSLTTHDKPTFVRHGVIHYCVPNIASSIPRTGSIAVSNILTNILLKIAQMGGVEKMVQADFGLRNGVYVYKGCLTNEYLGQRFQMKSTDLDLLITSIF